MQICFLKRLVVIPLVKSVRRREKRINASVAEFCCLVAEMKK